MVSRVGVKSAKNTELGLECSPGSTFQATVVGGGGWLHAQQAEEGKRERGEGSHIQNSWCFPQPVPPLDDHLIQETQADLGHRQHYCEVHVTFLLPHLPGGWETLTAEVQRLPMIFLRSHSRKSRLNIKNGVPKRTSYFFKGLI